jgi:hypothetical protein
MDTAVGKRESGRREPGQRGPERRPVDVGQRRTDRVHRLGRGGRRAGHAPGRPVLPASARPGTVAGRSRVVLSRPVTQPSLAAASLSPNGASFYLCTVSANRTRRLTKVVAYRTATGELREVIATLRGTPFLAGCPMGLDTTGRFLLVPYSLRSPHNPAGRAALLAARIDIATRATVILDLRLPANAGMDRYAGLRTAW